MVTGLPDATVLRCRSSGDHDAKLWFVDRLVGSSKRQNAPLSLEEESFRCGCPTDVQKPSRTRGSQILDFTPQTPSCQKRIAFPGGCSLEVQLAIKQHRG